MSSENYSDLSEEELDKFFELMFINKITKKRISIQLENTAGEVVPIKEVLEQVNEYVTNQLNSKETNSTIQQIFPLVAQQASYSVPRLAGADNAMFVFTSGLLKSTVLHQMIVSFYLLKFIQKNNLKIVTLEEDMTDEDIEKFEMASKLASVASMASLAGQDPKEVIKEMLKQGIIKKEDLKNLGIDYDTSTSGNNNQDN